MYVYSLGSTRTLPMSCLRAQRQLAPDDANVTANAHTAAERHGAWQDTRMHAHAIIRGASVRPTQKPSMHDILEVQAAQTYQGPSECACIPFVPICSSAGRHGRLQCCIPISSLQA